jgi:fumarylacetoacetate (FAA) hydrolase
MKLATLRNGHRDGQLVVVSRDLSHYTPAPAAYPSLQAALDTWDTACPQLQQVAAELEHTKKSATPLQVAALAAPLPRAYEWVDGSAYLNHVRLVRKARGAAVPPTLESDPLMYQGGSGVFLGARDPIALADAAWGLDFESEVAVILGDVAQGTSKAAAADSILLITLVNDVSLRNLIPVELAKGFGFFQSKPATAFAPVVVTPDELGDHFVDGRLHLRLRSKLNDVVVGDVDAGPEMHFSFCDLIAHMARTRAFVAGTVLGSGTVSNADPRRGVSCLAERRMIETIAQGAPVTPFMALGDRIEIEMTNTLGESVFGSIKQEVVPFAAAAAAAAAVAQRPAPARARQAG